MKVNLNWQGKLKFESTGETTGHTVTMDANEAAGGDASAPSPMEMVLHGAAGCMAIDIGVILRHRMDKVTKLAIEADGERADTEPKYYKQIKMNIIIDGDIPAKQAQRAADLSKDKYCSAVHSLVANVDVQVILNGEAL